jgi:hypothetical protein
MAQLPVSLLGGGVTLAGPVGVRLRAHRRE